MSIFADRRQRLAEQLADTPVILANGWERLRNPSNTYSFRGESHVIYFAGVLPAGAVLVINGAESRLYLQKVTVDDAVWSGPGADWAEVEERTGAKVYPLKELEAYVREVGVERWASLPVQDPQAMAFLEILLGRRPDHRRDERDLCLARAIVELRLINDEQAIKELREAGRITVEAHLAGMKATRVGGDERDVLAAMMHVLNRQGATTSFEPIISMAGERLHQPYVGGTLKDGALLLVDFGAENEQGWAGDVTNTWPISGKFTLDQRALFDIVVNAFNECVAMLKPGVRYRDVHKRAVEVLAAGLIDIGILRGTVEQVIERNAHAFFFPHGIGHLMGLDVHDMEDLGDIAGYQAGRERSKLFGWNCLRLDRDLRPGMVMTVEPGLYFIPELLDDAQIREVNNDIIDWEKVDRYRTARGIRFERDFLITETGCECLTPGLPSDGDGIEAAVQG